MLLILAIACAEIPSDNAEELETVTRHEVVIAGGQSGELCPGMPYQFVSCAPDVGICTDITAGTSTVDGCLVNSIGDTEWTAPTGQEYRLYWLD